VGSLLLDLRSALRSLRRSPGFVAVATVSLTVAIGLNAAVFGIVNGVLGRSLPVSRPHHLVRVGATIRGDGFTALSHPEYVDLRERMTTLERVLAHYPSTLILTAGDQPATEWMELVSADYFETLGVSPALGRTFTAAEAGPAAPPVVVISHLLWRRRFAGSPSAVGQTVKVNGRPFTVVGVAPEGFRGTFAGFGIDLWVPLPMHAIALSDRPSLERRSDRFLMIIGRIREGVPTGAVRAEAAVIARQWAAAYPSDYRDRGLAVVAARGVHPFIAGLVTAFLVLLQGIVAVVLLIAAGNLGGLVLARAMARRRELAVRSALGAGRWALMRSTVAECLLVAAPGAVLGVLSAHVASRLLIKVSLPVGVPVSLDFRVDTRVAGFAIAAAFLTALVAGAWPAWQSARSEVLSELRVAGASQSRERRRVRNTLVAIQVGFAAALLLNADLLLQSLRRSQSISPGFEADRVVVMTTSPDQLGYDEQRGRAFWDELLRRARATPGVESAARALFVPLGDRGDLLPMAAADRPDSAELRPYNYVSPGYFELLRIPLLAGREFAGTDDLRAPAVAIVSAGAATRIFADPMPLGRMLRVLDREGREYRAVIVGVVGDVKLRSPNEPPQPLVYLSFGQWYRPEMMLHVRTGASSPAPPLAPLVRSLDPDLPIRTQTMAEATGFALIPLRIAGSVLAVAGMAGLGLALIGIFGVVAFVVAQSTRELGIRMALGAGRRRILASVMGQGVTPVAAGLTVGLVVAIPASRLFRALLVDTRPLNPESVLGVSALVLGVTVAAVLPPARRAVRVDPVATLRAE